MNKHITEKECCVDCWFQEPRGFRGCRKPTCKCHQTTPTSDEEIVDSYMGVLCGQYPRRKDTAILTEFEKYLCVALKTARADQDRIARERIRKWAEKTEIEQKSAKAADKSEEMFEFGFCVALKQLRTFLTKDTNDV